MEAYKWISLVAAQGIAEAKSSQEALENVLTPAQLAEGKKRAAEFKPKTTGK